MIRHRLLGYRHRFGVEAGGESFAAQIAVHEYSVVLAMRLVPGTVAGVSSLVVDSGGDDAITRLAFTAARGDRSALTEFIRRTQNDVWRMHANMFTRDLADDLTQETFLRAIKALPSFGGRASARTWLMSIARRTGIDHIRAKGSRPQTVPLETVEYPGLGSFSESVAIRALLGSLQMDRREAFVLTQLLGYSYAEAADIAGCPVGTIRSRVARAREDLVNAYTTTDEASTG